MRSIQTNRKPAEIPLKTTIFTANDPETGSPASVTRHQRGVLVNEAWQYDLAQFRGWSDTSVLDDLKKLQEGLRDRLEELGLPSDRTPLWSREKGGEWKPYNKKRGAEIVAGRGYARWIKRAVDSSKPLSEGRLVAKLLLSLDFLLSRPGIEPHLWDIWQFTHAYHTLRVGVELNPLAVSALASRKGRSAGHKVLKARTAEVRRTICEQAHEYWNSNPRYRGFAANTADGIRDAVNARLRELKLQRRSDKPLSAKTIADHIRTGIRENILQTGSSGTKLASSEKSASA